MLKYVQILIKPYRRAKKPAPLNQDNTGFVMLCLILSQILTMVL